MEELNVASALTIILGGLGGLFTFAVLRPLNEAIVELRDAVKELRRDLEESKERYHLLDRKLVEVDNKAEAAHRRIDEFLK